MSIRLPRSWTGRSRRRGTSRPGTRPEKGPGEAVSTSFPTNSYAGASARPGYGKLGLHAAVSGQSRLLYDSPDLTGALPGHSGGSTKEICADRSSLALCETADTMDCPTRH